MSKYKKVIAGFGIAVGLGALPLSVFAADVTTQTDTLQVTINSSCSFGESASHTNGTATWSGNTASATMSNGTNQDTFATTALTVICNKATGYTIAAAGNPLASGSNSIPMNASHSATVSGWSLKATASGSGSLTVAEGYGVKHAAPATATTIASSNTTTDTAGDTLTIVYGVGVSQTQPAGSYSGTVTYTLAAATN